VKRPGADSPFRHQSKWNRHYDGEGGVFFCVYGGGKPTVTYNVRPYGKGKWAVERGEVVVSEFMSFAAAKLEARGIAARIDG
jgi:hypothetical protein